MAGLDPAIPLRKAQPCHIYRDRRVKPGDDGWCVNLIRRHPKLGNFNPCAFAQAIASS
jgi:hypothetical protein